MNGVLSSIVCADNVGNLHIKTSTILDDSCLTQMSWSLKDEYECSPIKQEGICDAQAI